MRGCGALPHTPAGEQSPLHPILTLTAGQEGESLAAFPLFEQQRPGFVTRQGQAAARRLRRTLTLHRAADELHRSSHDAAERGARGTAGGSAPRIRSAQGEAPCPCSVSSSISYPDRGRGSPAPLPNGERGVKARSARGEAPLAGCRGLAPCQGAVGTASPQI